MSQESLGSDAKVKGVVDIVFLIDASGSMGDCIQAVKDKIGVFISELSGGQVPVKDWRARVIGYRDAKCDGDQWLVTNPFVSNDQAALTAQLSSLTAEGGGDEPESLIDALLVVGNWNAVQKSEVADDSSWRHFTDARRSVVLFTDATFHPDAKSGATISDAFSLITSMKLELQYIVPDAPCYDSFESLPYAIPIERISAPFVGELKRMVTETSNFTEVMKAMARTITQPAAPTEVDVL
jgi:uncharacterized protein YegL